MSLRSSHDVSPTQLRSMWIGLTLSGSVRSVIRLSVSSSFPPSPPHFVPHCTHMPAMKLQFLLLVPVILPGMFVVCQKSIRGGNNARDSQLFCTAVSFRAHLPVRAVFFSPLRLELITLHPHTPQTAHMAKGRVKMCHLACWAHAGNAQPMLSLSATCRQTAWRRFSFRGKIGSIRARPVPAFPPPE